MPLITEVACVLKVGATRRASEIGDQTALASERPRAALPPEVGVDERVEFGGVVTKLGEIAKEAEADLIVVGSRGRGPIASALLGSVSQTLAQGAPCP